MKKTLTIAALFFAAITGTATASDQYEVKIESPRAKASAKAVASISVAPKGDFHFNKDYPSKLTLTAPEGVKLEKEKLTAKDAAKLDEHGVKFEVAFTADSAGKKTITGELKSAVCTKTECKPFVEKIAIEVEVK
ncbi:MAG: hypothetical protein IT372_16200 [Polyangiaceae bacterium]|nr:hypothetical protein [Polyangiaceae bacterium]